MEANGSLVPGVETPGYFRQSSGLYFSDILALEWAAAHQKVTNSDNYKRIRLTEPAF
jgi:hypothetical protein